MPKEIYHSEAISLPEVKELLVQRARESDGLSYMLRIALEHAQLVSKVSGENAKKLVEELVEKFRITDKGAITLANFLPDTIDEIRQLLAKEALSMETETVEEILNVLNSVEKLDETDKEIDIDALEAEGSDQEESDPENIPEDLRV